MRTRENSARREVNRENRIFQDVEIVNKCIDFGCRVFYCVTWKSCAVLVDLFLLKRGDFVQIRINQLDHGWFMIWRKSNPCIRHVLLFWDLFVL